ncbi:hypothetical protein [Mariniphaga sediminis]|uniref:hypothetical protein n=1 Tax=Mariniphaga sediminis TaxID=1628158 RepID=UPI0035653972
MRVSRRAFFRNATAATGGIVLCGLHGNLGASAAVPNLIKIETPFHGAVLNSRHGVKAGEGLKIEVQGEAPLNGTVTVNGVQARREKTKFMADVILRNTETEITAISNGVFGTNKHTIRVVWDKNSFPRYGFEIDDNIFFFRDIAKEKYRSLFDCFYLKGLRKLHQKYGTKVLLNIYFSDGQEYTKSPEFTLEQFPDRYKREWEDNADWLKLTFHAWANLPDRPYQDAPVQKLTSDLEKVSEQIIRFAGEQTYTPPTIVHWGMMPSHAYKSMAEKNVKVLRGYFISRENGKWDVNHNMDAVRSEYISHHHLLKDFDSGIVFSKIHLVCNSTPVEKIVPTLQPLLNHPQGAEILDLMTHEQYFWPFYANYLPDHFERLDKTIGWAAEHGYKPVFWNDGFLGAPA